MHLLLLACIAVASANAAVELFPFGSAEGDRQHRSIDDACDDRYRFPVVMYGTPFQYVYVCTNGILSLDQKYTTFTPRPFPLRSSTTVIAPYWADGDPKVGGKVWSRISTNPKLLRDASTIAKSAFLTAYKNGFTATRLLIATWEDVKPFGGSSSDLGNTFQVVVASDGNSTYAIFNYKEIHYTYGTASSGTPAQVGFDAGDGKYFYATNSSRTPRIVNITSESNIQVPGRLVFLIGEYKDTAFKVVVSTNRPDGTTKSGVTNNPDVTTTAGVTGRPTIPTTTPFIGIRLPDRVKISTKAPITTTTTAFVTKAVMSNELASLIEKILELKREQNRLTTQQDVLRRKCKLGVPVSRRRRWLDAGLEKFRKDVLINKIAVMEDQVQRMKAAYIQLSSNCSVI